MRLGTQTSSLTNHLYASATIGQPEPVVGMGATILCWTDRRAATIIEVGTHRGLLMVAVQDDTATRSDANGMSECQSYTYAPNPDGEVRRFVFKAGIWRSLEQDASGRLVLSRAGSGYGLRIGERHHYHDFSF